MTDVPEFLNEAPLAVCFVAVSFGYLLSRITSGQFVLGGIARTLFMGVAVTLVPQVIAFYFSYANFTKRT